MPLTAGCSNNSCTFCNFYGLKLQIRDIEEVKKEIDALAAYVKSGIHLADQPHIVYCIANEWDGQRIFLQDGDALVYPHAEMIEVLKYLNRCFPNLERIAAYATAQDVLRRSTIELRQLKKFKLGILYMGVESGDDKYLKESIKESRHNKSSKPDEKKEAGILSSVTIILGLGGIEQSGQHATATASILTALDPDYAGALTLSLIPGTPLYDQFRKGEFHLITPFQSLRELRTIIENSEFTNFFLARCTHPITIR